MRHSLQSHITYLEKLIQEVGDRLTTAGLAPEEVEDLQLQLFSAQGALEHYRQAYALELSASGSEPPQTTGDGKSDGGAPTPGKPGSWRAKAGRDIGGARMRRKPTCITRATISSRHVREARQAASLAKGRRGRDVAA